MSARRVDIQPTRSRAYAGRDLLHPGFGELPGLAEQILAGATTGRIVIDVGR